MDRTWQSPQKYLYEESFWKGWVYVIVAILVAVGFYFAIEPVVFEAIRPPEVKKAYEQAHKLYLSAIDRKLEVVKDGKKVVIPLPEDKALELRKKAKKIMEEIDRDYPKRPSLIGLIRSKYGWKGYVAYFGIILLSSLPLVGLWWYFQKRLKPWAFPSPYVEPPLDLGEFKENIDFEKAGIDRERFKSLFKSEKDYETFWRLFNKNVMMGSGLTVKVGLSYLKDRLGENIHLREEDWNVLKNPRKVWFRDLEVIFAEELFKRAKPSSAVRKRLGEINPAIYASFFEKLGDYYTFGYFFKEKGAYIPPKWDREEPLPGELWFLLSRFGAWDRDLISFEIGRLLDILQEWGGLMGIKDRDGLFRERIGLYLIGVLGQMFVRKNNIPLGLVNRFLRDETSKYLLSWLEKGLLIKPFNEATKTARDYMLIFHSLKNHPDYLAGLSVSDYLNYKYNLIFEVLYEDKGKELRKKLKIYENKFLW